MSGLCGSITTFSSWMVECNKSLYLQADLGAGLFASYNGGEKGPVAVDTIITFSDSVTLPYIPVN